MKIGQLLLNRFTRRTTPRKRTGGRAVTTAKPGRKPRARVLARGKSRISSGTSGDHEPSSSSFSSSRSAPRGLRKYKIPRGGLFAIARLAAAREELQELREIQELQHLRRQELSTAPAILEEDLAPLKASELNAPEPIASANGLGHLEQELALRIPDALPTLHPPESEPVSESASAGRLTTESLIRPDDVLTRSIEAFLMDQRSPHTQRAYGKDLKRFVRFLAARKHHRGLESFDRTVLIAYKDSLLTEKLEHTTIDRHLATLRSFFRWLVDDGFLTKNPAEGVRFMNPKRVSRTQAFTDEEVVKVLARPNLHTRIGSQHYAILAILFYCGLRRSEVCDLRMSNLGEERGHAIFRLRGKGDAERVIVLTPPVVKALQHYFKITGRNPGGRTGAKDSYLFTPIRNNRTGEAEKRLDPSMIFYIVRKYAKAAGIQNRVSPHSCRATAISNARDHQVPDRAIQEFAGWASPDMITRYDKRKTAVEKSAAHAIRYGEKQREIPVVRDADTD